MPSENVKLNVKNLESSFDKLFEHLKHINYYVRLSDWKDLKDILKVVSNDDTQQLTLDEALGFRSIIKIIEHCSLSLNLIERDYSHPYKILLLQLSNFLVEYKIMKEDEIYSLFKNPDFLVILNNHLTSEIIEKQEYSTQLWPSYKDLFLYGRQTKNICHLLAILNLKQWEVFLSQYIAEKSNPIKTLEKIHNINNHIVLFTSYSMKDNVSNDIIKSLPFPVKEKELNSQERLISALLDLMGQKFWDPMIDTMDASKHFISLYYTLEFVYSINKNVKIRKGLNASYFLYLRDKLKILKRLKLNKESFREDNYRYLTQQLEKIELSLQRKYDTLHSHDQSNGFCFVLNAFSKEINYSLKNINDF
ncbi:hypothetical protein BY996DRAFT_969758 [Phakopsora pachyrhizi]|uniref:Expressed protein n=1 Tax=Phakopsora pachyrhizi TaxID=170000 RepID=A0AAV0BTA2_PHAPC|nr:hypothetical protein BY996DRAFT_969758 [Phakopsora pachyrhizi]CAH7690675.1 expressed protein [Phakopsora pachyrhizi]